MYPTCLANGVSPIDGVRRSWKTVIYRVHRGDLQGTKEYSGANAAQFCDKIISILLSVHALERPEKIRKKKTKCRKCHGCFLRTRAFSRERAGIIVFDIVPTFASTVLCAQFPLCRMLAAVSIVLRYTNNHHHPYIDSTVTTSCTYRHLYTYVNHAAHT